MQPIQSEWKALFSGASSAIHNHIVSLFQEIQIKKALEGNATGEIDFIRPVLVNRVSSRETSRIQEFQLASLFSAINFITQELQKEFPVGDRGRFHTNRPLSPSRHLFSVKSGYDLLNEQTGTAEYSENALKICASFRLQSAGAYCNITIIISEIARPARNRKTNTRVWPRING